MLTPLERFALDTNSLRFGEKVKLLRSARTMISLDQDSRNEFRGPFQRWGAPLRRWMMLRLVINNPRLILLGVPAAILSWLVLLANAAFKFL
ncbi:hypothetical protein KBW71_07945 [Hydrogenophaga aromaticivorans]|uniref:hypothetical protein n=1 Tax=Hydrogenophaga aromaticivorans TaxID=2610898 RepID=UPI001B35F64B|nr:hypothetical protein [Hydrogenophaga aromaticivorans]MBQ0918373.1 hypothetical protein [Hydrogenophaga aromaticivorans]